MTDTTDRVRAHYNGPGLVDRIKAALAPIADEDEPLTVAQLTMLDQLHTRGILATAALASKAAISASVNSERVRCFRSRRLEQDALTGISKDWGDAVSQTP